MYGAQWENGYGGWVLFLFLFLGIKILEKFNPKIEKLVGFKIEKNSKFFSISLPKNGKLSPKKRNTGWAPQELGKWVQVSMKVSGETQGFFKGFVM